MTVEHAELMGSNVSHNFGVSTTYVITDMRDDKQ